MPPRRRDRFSASTAVSARVCRRPRAAARSTMIAVALAGLWVGTSLCTIPASPCHNERAAFHFSAPNANNVVQLIANKVVNGREEYMGTLDFRFDPQAMTLVHRDTRGTWSFTIDGDRITGTLIVPGRGLYRRIALRHAGAGLP